MEKMNKHFGVYPMEECDIPAVENLYKQLVYNQMSRDEYYEKDVDAFLHIDNSKYFKYAFDSPDCSIFVAKYKDNIIGFIEMWFYKKDFYFNIEDYAYGMNLFVDKDKRTGTNPMLVLCKLYHACEKEAIRRGYRYIGGDVFEFNNQMQAIMKYFEFKPYRTRYIKRLDKK